MKKSIALLLALVMIFVMCGCGESNNVTAGGNSKTDYVTIDEVRLGTYSSSGYSHDKIDFRFTLNYPENLHENYAEVMQIIYSYVGKNEDVITKKTLQINHNVRFSEEYLGSTAGNVHQSFFEIDTDTVSKIVFNGYVLWNQSDADYKKNWYENYDFNEPIEFSIEELKAAKAENQIVCSIGDTIATDTLELAVNGVTFERAVKGSGNASWAASGDDMILCCIDISARNISKQKIYLIDYLDVVIDYNDGYKYTTGDGLSYLFNSDKESIVFYFNGYADGVSMQLSPLSNGDYLLAVPCNKILAEDDTSALKIIFNLPNENTTQEFAYVIR